MTSIVRFIVSHGHSSIPIIALNLLKTYFRIIPYNLYKVYSDTNAAVSTESFSKVMQLHYLLSDCL